MATLSSGIANLIHGTDRLSALAILVGLCSMIDGVIYG
jgi:hypothetical protein